MIKTLLAIFFLLSLEAATANTEACSGIGIAQAYESINLHGTFACFVYSQTGTNDEQQLSRDPDGISVYEYSEIGKPKLVYELPYAGTDGIIHDAFLIPDEGTDEDMLFVIHSFKTPKSWDAVSDIYSVSVIKTLNGSLVRDSTLSRFFDLGGDLIDAHGRVTYTYPYKDKKSVEDSVRSSLFKAVRSGVKIKGTIQEKAFLYTGSSEPSAPDPKKSYLIKGDQITLEDSIAGWCKILYQGKNALISKWMQCRYIDFTEKKNGS